MDVGAECLSVRLRLNGTEPVVSDVSIYPRLTHSRVDKDDLNGSGNRSRGCSLLKILNICVGSPKMSPYSPSLFFL